MSDTTRLYTSRPQQVEAIQWTGDVRAIDRSPFGGVVAWACDDEGEDLLLRAGKDGAQGWVPVPLGHWLVRNPGDPSDNWPVDPDHFAAKYQRAESVPDPVDVALLAVEAWHADPGDGMPPHEVWWDSIKDAWFDGFETGYKAALAQIGDE